MGDNFRHWADQLWLDLNCLIGWLYVKKSSIYQRKFSGKLPIYELLGSRRGIVVSSSSQQ